jgi:hypothetical protein
MRIALVPLDSRPPSWQLPQRLAGVGRAELVLPPRELLGTLHQAGDQRALLEWLARTAPDCDAAVLSWDALVYGGLVQSRTEGTPLGLRELVNGLSAVDWKRCRGYLWLTVPRLGLTIASAEDWDLHRRIAQFFIAWGAANDNPSDAAIAELKAVEAQLPEEAVARAWALRQRNQEHALLALRLSAELGLKRCHVAVEDNARSGPHLQEVAALQRHTAQLIAELRHQWTGEDFPHWSFFDGTDECGSLLTARALLDLHHAAAQPVRLSLFPASPGPGQYYGLYESRSLEDGLHFLSGFLDLPFRAEGGAQWLVCYGRQPQPDAFAEDPARIYNNPYLLPDTLTGTEPLFVADLAACNGGNPHLALRLGELAGARLRGYSAWNTNFNALGFSAATLAVAGLPGADPAALRTLLLERLADDCCYQSIARPKLLALCRERGVNPFDLSNDPALQRELESLALMVWGTWSQGHAKGLLEGLGLRADEVGGVEFRLPWARLFEAEVST